MTNANARVSYCSDADFEVAIICDGDLNARGYKYAHVRRDRMTVEDCIRNWNIHEKEKAAQ